jgi:hypothetical protein
MRNLRLLSESETLVEVVKELMEVEERLVKVRESLMEVVEELMAGGMSPGTETTLRFRADLVIG